MSAIHFLGAAGTVTGSRHLVEHAGKRVLLDCGLFQGRKEYRLRNWQPLGVPAQSIDAVVLSHAHIDHTGWLPRLVKDGFSGPVYTSGATADLLKIMLPDSARIQQEEATWANKKGYSKHQPALPLYNEDEANKALTHIERVGYTAPRKLFDGIDLVLHRAGHILGSATVELQLTAAGAPLHRLVFSGDLGRYDMPIIPDPDPLKEATTLLVESTYGDRLHQEHDPRGALADEVNRLCEDGGALVIPTFAIGRAQDLLYHLKTLQDEGRIPDVPMFVDSPMACDATPLYLLHREEHDDEMIRLMEAGAAPLAPRHVKFTTSVDESRRINDIKGPVIILSASGMAVGGRVLHHLANRLPDAKNRILFVGYQAEGTRGRKLLEGATSIKIHGQDVKVRASIAKIDGFSAHADYKEIDRWLSTLPAPPARTFLIHGEPDALEAARARLAARGWNVQVPAYMDRVEL